MSNYESKIGKPWKGYYLSAYGIAVKHGFTGTEEEWLETLRNNYYIPHVSTVDENTIRMSFIPRKEGMPKLDNVEIKLPAGITPHIGANGNWYLGDTDTGVKAKGATPKLTIGTVETLEAGSPATASIGGTAENPTMNLGIPNGKPGDPGSAAIIEITGVKALEYGSAPTVTELAGSTDQARKYNLGIPAGKPGADGKTPVKGVDYMTDAEWQAFNDQSQEYIATELAKRGQLKPEFANSIDECIDTSKLYVLPDGYIYAYMTKTVTKRPINQIKESKDKDGTPYNGGLGYKSGYAISGTDGSDYSNGVHELNCISGYIPCKNGDFVCSIGIPFYSGALYRQVAFYDANFTCLRVLSTGGYWALDSYLDGENLSFNVSDIDTSQLSNTQKASLAYIRVSGGITDNSVVAINESAETTTETVTDWMNTGHAFVPADYEDRIIALEKNRYAKSRHDGKICVCFGDSIVGNMESPNDYPTVLGKETGMTVINAGFGGCRMSASMSTVYNAYSMVKLADAITTGDWTEQDAGLSSVSISHYAPHVAALKGIDWNNVDFITIGYGTNDIANFVNVDNANNPMDTTTVLGGLRYALTTILTSYPHIKVLILTPIYRYFNDEGVDSDEKEWYDGRKFTTWIDGILDVAKEFRVPSVDMYRTLGFNKLTRSYYFPSNDGTHPNKFGLQVIAGKIAGKLLSEY